LELLQCLSTTIVNKTAVIFLSYIFSKVPITFVHISCNALILHARFAIFVRPLAVERDQNIRSKTQ